MNFMLHTFYHKKKFVCGGNSPFSLDEECPSPGNKQKQLDRYTEFSGLCYLACKGENTIKGLTHPAGLHGSGRAE